MNVAEAKRTQDLLEWVVSLTAFDNGSAVADDELVDAVRYLGERAFARLGAGPNGPSLHRQALVMLGIAEPGREATG